MDFWYKQLVCTYLHCCKLFLKVVCRLRPSVGNRVIIVASLCVLQCVFRYPCILSAHTQRLSVIVSRVLMQYFFLNSLCYLIITNKSSKEEMGRRN